ncbi:MAG: type II toxin-antitoxin system RelE/ParE family toxin [Acidobacteriota bacterium]|nr:type II toxin-antitoxin system RelE/ParE family toxin [Acidobacteriota bacterium]
MARREVRWGAPALEDFIAAAEYIALDSRPSAAALVRVARAAAHSLDRFAQRGRSLKELGPNVRELFVQSYRLIYEVHEAAVDILAFVHGARNLAAWW